jgi:DNA-directed RNA polymerase specialized sigma24 family protein
MDEHDWLAQRFEAHRTHLRAVAYRMLGSLSEADLSDAGGITNEELEKVADSFKGATMPDGSKYG